MNASSAMPGSVCTSATTRITPSAARGARSSPTPSGTATTTAQASAMTTSSTCRDVCAAIVARRPQRYPMSETACVLGLVRVAESAAGRARKRPSIRRASAATRSAGSPPTSSRSLSVRIVATSRRPPNSARAASAPGARRASAPETSGAASYGGKKCWSSVSTTRSYRASRPSVEYPSITSTLPSARARYFTAGSSARTSPSRSPYCFDNPGRPSGRPMKSGVKPARNRLPARPRSLRVPRCSESAVARRTAIA